MDKAPRNFGPAQAPGASPDTVPFGAADIPASEKAGRVGAVFESVAPRYDVMNDLMSFGAHRLWKAAAVDWLMPLPAWRVLDVAGGTGDMAIRIARRVGGPAAMAAAGGGVTVIDTSAAMMAVGRQRVAARGLGPAIEFCAGDAESLAVADGAADAYVIAFGLRNVTHPMRALEEAYRVLAPGGRFLCLEFSKPRWPLLGPVYDRYCDHVLPWVGGMVADDAEAYCYLGESIRRFPDQKRLAAMIEAAGFGQVRVRDLIGGIAAIHSAWRL
ncbi:MAG: bifunctional demethylmenaquinone methyltransferase/2-methoxy-6-polyprenyl-1,4-benzoquinol methylase UbiE [Alphaproteobacteria bacterium]|nr:MAG: bifunctional demethylmenaquinone methyltransferase/2-methoxy-6-polyprenyl-1,4-benzoquinol methylase UbiE [Alphaproteobacteria bacterium]